MKAGVSAESHPLLPWTTSSSRHGRIGSRLASAPLGQAAVSGSSASGIRSDRAVTPQPLTAARAQPAVREAAEFRCPGFFGPYTKVSATPEPSPGDFGELRTRDLAAPLRRAGHPPDELRAADSWVRGGAGVSGWTPAPRRGCRIKPSEIRRRALAEVHARAAVRDDLATDRLLATNEVADFGAHP